MMLQFPVLEHVTSTNKQVMEECTSFKEGTARLINKLYYFARKNALEDKGMFTVVSMSTLVDAVGRSRHSVSRYLKVAVSEGLLVVEKVKDKHYKLRFKITPTEKLIILKNCSRKVQVAQKSEQTAQQNPYEDRINPEVLEPSLYINISKGLNRTRETFNVDLVKETTTAVAIPETEEDSNNEELLMEDCSSLKHLPGTDTPKEGKAEQITSPIPLTPTQAALELFQEFNQQLAKPLAVDTRQFAKSYSRLNRSHFGTLAEFRRYLEKVFKNPFLLGQRSMKSGDRFNLSVGFILTPQTIEAAWDNKGFFDLWLTTTYKKDQIKEQEITSLPKLTLEEAMPNATGDFDKAVKVELFNLLPEHQYRSWIHTTGFKALGIRDEEPEFTGSPAVVSYLKNYQGDALRLAFENAAKVTNCPELPSKDPTLELEAIKKAAQSDFDRAVKVELYQSIGKKAYGTWFHNENFTALSMQEGLPHFVCKDLRFIKHFNNLYPAKLQQAFAKASAGEITAVEQPQSLPEPHTLNSELTLKEAPTVPKTLVNLTAEEIAARKQYWITQLKAMASIQT